MRLPGAEFCGLETVFWRGLGVRAGQGWAAPGGGQALMRSRPAGQVEPRGTAGESFAGQHGCGSRLSGQAAPGKLRQRAAARRWGQASRAA
jgi:hypothetical protein